MAPLRLKLMGTVAGALLAVVLFSVAASGEAAAAAPPGPPTAVRATAVAGESGVTVSWGAPVSDGGSPVLYYSASNYAGNYNCVSKTPGAGSCHIAGIRIGAVRPSIRVRAVNSAGRGPIAVVFPVVSQPDPANGTASTASSSGTGAAGADPGSPAAASAPASSASSASGPGASSSDPASSSGAPATLPFSGADVQQLFLVGMGLVLGGLLILSPLGRRRKAPVYRSLTTEVAAWPAWPAARSEAPTLH